MSNIIRKGLFSAFKAVYKNYMAKVSKGIPTMDLEAKQLENARLLPNRTELLKLLPKSATVAELGVDEGGFSKQIMEICQPQKLHLIDLWGSKRYNQNKKQGVEKQFESEIAEGRVEINLGYSTQVVGQFEDQYFDWIYIDTDHTYKTTRDELEMYRPKVKPGGIMAGHDFIKGNFEGMVRYGVIDAVYEFCKKHDWELIYLTMEMTYPPSFAIRRRA